MSSIFQLLSMNFSSHFYSPRSVCVFTTVVFMSFRHAYFWLSLVNKKWIVLVKNWDGGLFIHCRCITTFCDFFWYCYTSCFRDLIIISKMSSAPHYSCFRGLTVAVAARKVSWNKMSEKCEHVIKRKGWPLAVGPC